MRARFELRVKNTGVWVIISWCQCASDEGVEWWYVGHGVCPRIAALQMRRNDFGRIVSFSLPLYCIRKVWALLVKLGPASGLRGHHFLYACWSAENALVEGAFAYVDAFGIDGGRPGPAADSATTALTIRVSSYTVAMSSLLASECRYCINLNIDFRRLSARKAHSFKIKFFSVVRVSVNVSQCFIRSSIEASEDTN